MRSVVGNKLRKEFKKCFCGKYTQFKEDKQIIIPPGYRVFRYKLEIKMSFFIELCISQKQDEYTIEFGWGCFENNQVPEYTVLKNCSNTEKTIEELILKEEARIRLGRIINPSDQTDRWYLLGLDWKNVPCNAELYLIQDIPIEEALKNLELSLIDVMEKIDKYIIPCFRRVAEKHEYSFD